MNTISRALPIALIVVWLAGCQTTPSLLAPVPQVALATSYYQEVFDIDRRVVTQFKPTDAIAISVYIPRGCGFGERDGTLTVRDGATGRVIRHETRPMKETDYIAFKQENPGPGRYNVQFSADDGVLATTHFVVQ